MSYKQAYNPVSDSFNLVPDTVYQETTKQFQTIDGSTVSAFSLTIPDLASCFAEVVLMGKLEGGNEFYTELITYRFINPDTGNVLSLAGGTVSLSENFTVNPARALSLGATTATLLVNSGGIQTINWECTVRYKIVNWGI